MRYIMQKYWQDKDVFNRNTLTRSSLRAPLDADGNELNYGFIDVYVSADGEGVG